MNEITMKMNADKLILMALQEDITSEDVTTNAIMPEKVLGEVDLICKGEGVIAGLAVFARTFELLDKDIFESSNRRLQIYKRQIKLL